MVRAPKPTTSAADFLPAGRLSIESLRAAAAGCRGCDLWQRGTQTVFGEGQPRARIVLVGEQPGDQEDLRGRPFVGPAGAVLDRALEEAKLARESLYVTNAVKHFKWIQRGKRRIHQKPVLGQVNACRPWLEAEIAVLKPEIIVALGATAAQSLLGKTFRLTQQRGEFFEDSPWAPATVIATLHPSAVLRMPDPATREEAYQGLVADLVKIKRRLAA